MAQFVVVDDFQAADTSGMVTLAAGDVIESTLVPMTKWQAAGLVVTPKTNAVMAVVTKYLAQSQSPTFTGSLAAALLASPAGGNFVTMSSGVGVETAVLALAGVDAAAILALQGDVATAMTDVGTLQTDVGTLQTDVGTAQADIGTLQTDVGTLQADVGTAQTDIGTLQTDVGTLQTDVSGLMSLAFRYISTNDLIVGTDRVLLIDAGLVNVTATLPAAASMAGVVLYAKRLDASVNTAEIAAAALEFIDGSATQPLLAQYSVLRLISDGTSWHVL